MEPAIISISEASLADINLIQEIGRKTFYDSFIAITPEAAMQEYLNSAFNFTQLTQELNDSNSKFYLVYFGENIAGYGKINFLKSPYGLPVMPNAMEIQRIYIDLPYQGIGAANQLMQLFFKEAKARSLHNIWLSTGSFNNKALHFYKKYGFNKIGNHEFWVGAELFDDVILHKELGITA